MLQSLLECFIVLKVLQCASECLIPSVESALECFKVSQNAPDRPRVIGVSIVSNWVGPRYVCALSGL